MGVAYYIRSAWGARVSNTSGIVLGFDIVYTPSLPLHARMQGQPFRSGRRKLTNRHTSRSWDVKQQLTELSIPERLQRFVPPLGQYGFGPCSNHSSAVHHIPRSFT
jgi:hypothetical protein